MKKVSKILFVSMLLVMMFGLTTGVKAAQIASSNDYDGYTDMDSGSTPAPTTPSTTTPTTPSTTTPTTTPTPATKTPTADKADKDLSQTGVFNTVGYVIVAGIVIGSVYSYAKIKKYNF